METIVLHLMQTILKKVLFAPTLLVCEQPLQATNVHTTEAFGPVCTLMPYQNIEELADLVSRGEGSLVASVVKTTMKILNRLFKNCALAWPCACTRCRVSKRKYRSWFTTSTFSTRRPGRAGGGEELGGIRAVKHYMQRTAIQGSPNSLTQITHSWTAGSKVNEDRVHPFKSLLMS